MAADRELNPAKSTPQRPSSAKPPVLPDDDAGQRVHLLADLQRALAAQGVSSVLARNHRLVLRPGRRPWEPSGQTDPQLHIFAAHGTDIVTTDGRTYRFASGQAHPANDPQGAANTELR